MKPTILTSEDLRSCASTPTTPSSSRFVVLGRKAEPRWFVPANHRLHGDSFLGWQPYRMTSRLAWGVMTTALRWGAARALPTAHTTDLDGISDLDWNSLGWRRPSAPELLVYLGTPGNTRKAILHLIDRSSHACELIVKVPLTEAAKCAIEREAQTLLELQDEGFLAAPRLVAFDRSAGISSQTVMRGSRAGIKLTREVADLLQSLQHHSECITLREVASSLEKAAAQRERSAPDAALMTSALESMDDASELPAARLHGDFAPWNIKLHDSSAALIDWEDSQPRGLPLHDAYHFVHMARCLFGRRPQPVSQELRFRYPFALSSSIRWKLEIAYLLQTLLRAPATRDQKYPAFLLATLRRTIADRP